MRFEPVPQGVRVAVYNAMGGWGPYNVREVEELFQMYGFTETAETEDLGGVRRTAAESYQRCIDWGDPEQRRRYLMLIDDVLENYPDADDGKRNPEAKRVRRALKLAGVEPEASAVADADKPADDLWPVGTVRVFMSHLAERKAEVHELADVLRAIGFSCFVAHDQIQPSRAWQREIERALRSCDLLVAYVAPGFGNSQWTDQEVGWALGRELIAVPVSVDGEMPRGFLGTYQALPRRANQRAVSLGREVCRAIVDAAFEEQRPAAKEVRSRVAALVATVFCKVRNFENARFWYELLVRIPRNEWTITMRGDVDRALVENDQLANAVLDDDRRMRVPDAVAALLR